MRTSCVTAVTFAAGLFAAEALAAQAVRDSAGIQIVENKAPSLRAARAWRVDPKPTLVIGDPTAPTEGDSLYEFGGVMGLARLANGHWVIGVQSANQLRFYDATGKYLKSAGRAGAGPGEFRQIMGLRPARGDTLVVTDQFEVEYFTTDGKFIAQGASRRSTPGTYVWPSSVFPDRSYVGLNFNDRTVPPAGRQLRRLPMYHVSADGLKLDTLAVVVASEMVFGGRAPYGEPVTFAPNALVATAGNRVYYMFPATAEVMEMTSAGQEVRRIRLAIEPRTVSAGDREQHLEWILNRPGEMGGPVTPQVRALNERNAARTVFADRLPTHSLMLADPAGNLWLRRFDSRQERYRPGPVSTRTVDAPSTWDVVSPTGRWLCTVESPANFTPLEIGADYMAGVAHDADDIKMIKVYRIVKP